MGCAGRRLCREFDQVATVSVRVTDALGQCNVQLRRRSLEARKIKKKAALLLTPPLLPCDSARGRDSASRIAGRFGARRARADSGDYVYARRELNGIAEYNKERALGRLERIEGSLGKGRALRDRGVEN